MPMGAPKNIRLFVKVYSQQQDIDCEEAFALVARFEIVRTFLALAAHLNWSMYQFDGTLPF